MRAATSSHGCPLEGGVTAGKSDRDAQAAPVTGFGMTVTVVSAGDGPVRVARSAPLVRALDSDRWRLGSGFRSQLPVIMEFVGGQRR
jgi:hypothetical protein